MTSIHGHQVLTMIQENRYVDEQALLAAMAHAFGPEARFHTCSASQMTAQQLVDFLKAKGKFHTVSEGYLSINADRICSH